MFYFRKCQTNFPVMSITEMRGAFFAGNDFLTGNVRFADLEDDSFQARDEFLAMVESEFY